MLGQKATSRLAQSTFCAVALNRTADLLGGSEANPDGACRFAAARFHEHGWTGRTKARAHEQKLCAFGQALQGWT